MSSIVIRAPGLSQPIEIDQRPDKKVRQGSVRAPAAAGGSKDKQQSSLLGGRWFLIRGEVEECPGAGLDGWLMCLAQPFGGAVCKGHI